MCALRFTPIGRSPRARLWRDTGREPTRLSLPPRLFPSRSTHIWSVREAALGLCDRANRSRSSRIRRWLRGDFRDYIERFLALLDATTPRRGCTLMPLSVFCTSGPVVDLKTERREEVRVHRQRRSRPCSGIWRSPLSATVSVRSPFMVKMSPELYEAFRTIKRTFDPQGRLESRKDLRPAAAYSQPALRGAGYRTSNPRTFFDYSDYGGIAGAVEMCSGLGVCRKSLEGTRMCPSYMATRRDALYARTSRRAPASAIAGRLDEAGLGDQASDGPGRLLCLECRACKAECPVSVDVARFKSEFLASYWSRHGVPLRAHALGNLDVVSNGRAGESHSPT